MLLTLVKISQIQLVLQNLGQLSACEHVVGIEQGYWSCDMMWGLVSMRMCAWCGTCWIEAKQIFPWARKKDVFGIILAGQGLLHHFAATFSHVTWWNFCFQAVSLSAVFWKINSALLDPKEKNKKRKEGSIFEMISSPPWSQQSVDINCLPLRVLYDLSLMSMLLFSYEINFCVIYSLGFFFLY